jgi:hypothetical protein
MTKPIALLTADWHLSHRPPVARSKEPNWYEAQLRPMKQIGKILNHNGGVPILFAGDLVHHWNEPVELANWMVQNLPGFIYGIPGQHDLPFHQVKDIHRSAYHTLYACHKLIEVRRHTLSFPNFLITGFPFGAKLVPPILKLKSSPKIRIALIHRYIWSSKASYPNAPKSQHFSKLIKELGKNHGYTHIVTGDNHIAFETEINGVKIFNCGSIINRNSDQRVYRPSVGILYDNGSIKRVYLDTSKDKWLEDGGILKISSTVPDLSKLVEEFRRLNISRVNFLDLLEKKTSDPKLNSRVKKALLEIIEEVKT